MRAPCLIDAIRTRYPHLALALYAYEPGGPVTLEVLGPQDRTFSTSAPTAEMAIARLFPEVFEDPAPAEPAPVATDINLFD